MEESFPWLKEIDGKIQGNTPSALKKRRAQKEEAKKKG
jgi:hypothetical protein